MNFELQRAIMAYRGQIQSGEKEDGTPIFKNVIDTHEWSVLMAFSNFARADDPLQEIYPGVDLLARTTQMTTRQIYRVLRSLEQKQFLERAGMKGHIRAYKFVPGQLQFVTEKLAKKKKPDQILPEREEELPHYEKGLPATSSPDQKDKYELTDEQYQQELERIRQKRANRRRRAEQAFLGE